MNRKGLLDEKHDMGSYCLFLCTGYIALKDRVNVNDVYGIRWK
jgi:hypothetical protein